MAHRALIRAQGGRGVPEAGRAQLGGAAIGYMEREETARTPWGSGQGHQGTSCRCGPESQQPLGWDDQH